MSSTMRRGTCSKLSQNTSTIAAIIRLSAVGPGRFSSRLMVEVFCDSFEQVPRRIVLDIDDTEDPVHGQQQLALFNAYYDSPCFQPIHIFEARPANRWQSSCVPARRRTKRWSAGSAPRHPAVSTSTGPTVHILVRGDSHYGRPEAMAWCERKRIGYIFGLAGNAVLLRRVGDLAEDAALGRLAGGGRKGPPLRRLSLMPPPAGTSSAAYRPASRPCNP